MLLITQYHCWSLLRCRDFGTETQRMVDDLNAEQMRRNRKLSTCLSSVNALLLELREVYEARAVVAPNDRNTDGVPVVTQVGLSLFRIVMLDAHHRAVICGHCTHSEGYRLQ